MIFNPYCVLLVRRLGAVTSSIPTLAEAGSATGFSRKGAEGREVTSKEGLGAVPAAVGRFIVG
jgi:hypothetical protein